MTIDVVKDKLGQFIKNFMFWGKRQLINDGHSISLWYREVTVHYHWLTKYDLFETQITAY